MAGRSGVLSRTDSGKGVYDGLSFLTEGGNETQVGKKSTDTALCSVGLLRSPMEFDKMIAREACLGSTCAKLAPSRIRTEASLLK